MCASSGRIDAATAAVFLILYAGGILLGSGYDLGVLPKTLLRHDLSLCGGGLTFCVLDLVVIHHIFASTDRDDGSAPLVHGQPHWHVGLGPVGGRHLRSGFGSQQQLDLARYAAHCRQNGQAGQSQGGRLASERRRT